MKRFIPIASAFALLLSGAAYAEAFTGSITVKGKKSKEYHTLATVTLQDAVAAALTKVPGKAVDAELDDEKGFLVYEIKVIAADNSTHKILVDAGNQAILREEKK